MGQGEGGEEDAFRLGGEDEKRIYAGGTREGEDEAHLFPPSSGRGAACGFSEAS